MKVEKMMKSLFQFCLLLIVVSADIVAQNPGAKWLEVIRTDSQSIYIDTTNIKHIENQITAVNLTVFDLPRFINQYNKDAKSIKSQILFNIPAKKYTILGTLYYDDRLRIIGESNLPGVSVGNDAFSSPIDSNSVLKELYATTLRFLSIDTSAYEKPVDDGNKIQQLIDNSSIREQQNIAAADTGKLIEKEKPVKQTVIPNIVEGVKPSSEKPFNNASNQVYNTSSERNIRGMIFSDGNKYCFQVSSWKNRSKAENETARLKDEGYNAFIVEAYLPNKGGTWYRVRIGYFNTLEEAETYSAKLQ